jgi:hypothetical protein
LGININITSFSPEEADKANYLGCFVASSRVYIYKKMAQTPVRLKLEDYARNLVNMYNDLKAEPCSARFWSSILQEEYRIVKRIAERQRQESQLRDFLIACGVSLKELEPDESQRGVNFPS